jgi:hypothetical protein
MTDRALQFGAHWAYK